MDAVNHMGGEGVGGGRKRVWCGAVCLRLCFHHFVAAHCLVDALHSFLSFLSSPPHLSPAVAGRAASKALRSLVSKL